MAFIKDETNRDEVYSLLESDLGVKRNVAEAMIDGNVDQIPTNPRISVEDYEGLNTTVQWLYDYDRVGRVCTAEEVVFGAGSS